MKNLKKIFITLSIYIVSTIIAFVIGRNMKINTYSDTSKIEFDLQNAETKLTEVNKRNVELEELVTSLKRTNAELLKENESMKSDLNNIKESTEHTLYKLSKLDNSVQDSSSVIKNLKENQKLFREYIQSVSDVTKEW